MINKVKLNPTWRFSDISHVLHQELPIYMLCKQVPPKACKFPIYSHETGTEYGEDDVIFLEEKDEKALDQWEPRAWDVEYLRQYIKEQEEEHTFIITDYFIGKLDSQKHSHYITITKVDEKELDLIRDLIRVGEHHCFHMLQNEEILDIFCAKTGINKDLIPKIDIKHFGKQVLIVYQPESKTFWQIYRVGGR